MLISKTINDITFVVSKQIDIICILTKFAYVKFGLNRQTDFLLKSLKCVKLQFFAFIIT